MSKKVFSKFAMFTLAIALIFSVAACSGNDGASNGSSEGTSNETATNDSNQEEQKDKVTLKMLGWTNKAVNDYITELNEAFMEEYPEVEVEYTVTASDDVYKQLMQSRLAAEDVDLFPNLSGFILSPQEWSPGAEKPNWQQWIEAGQIADLTGESFLDNYNASDIENGGMFDGKVYGVPVGTTAFTGLYYNKDIFADHGLEVPTTWDEFINVLDTLQDNEVTPLAFAGKDTWPLAITVQGLQASILGDQLEFIRGLWTGESKFTDEKPLEVLTKAQQMMGYAINGFMGIDYATLPSLFTSGQVAMMGDGAWKAPELTKDFPDLNFGYFPIPGSDNAEDNKSLAGKYDMTYLVAENAPNKEYAIKWLEFFSQPENYTEFVNASGMLPVQPNVVADSEFVNEISPYLQEFKLGYEQLFINRPNAGEHIANAGVHAEYIAPGGPIETAQELAEIQQQEWEDAEGN
ncbi:ABC transporter substrate-binding protein [Cytobacillus sp. IB215316]|uniref:ABC transporter substrate-binding protein n=1 Tax=Cytobacillus sp. IB215316 TaxID=3097354 RepID=UPI002A0E3F29|nr:extracellular solute-binding protein [Cytobacillus sp. IB215316]MDX8361312.1 extracellular solute-binding protein [Cytobacillus sp. IB215316]